MRLLLDTNRYRDFCDAVPDVVEALATANEIHMSLFMLAELRAGFMAGTIAKRNEAVLARFLDRPRIRLCAPDTQTTFLFAQLFAQLRKQGTPIPTHDIWLGALTLQHELFLYTRDRHFDHLPQVPRWP